MPPAATVYVACGANLGDRAATLAAARADLDAHPEIRVRRGSTWHETRPVGGPPDQPDYLNGVLELETTLAPLALLDVLQQIEHRHARVRSVPDAPRTLDLDILLYDHQRIRTDRLTVPHPRMWQRSFVLEPLAELLDLDHLRRACGPAETNMRVFDLIAGDLDWRDTYHLCIGFINPRPIALVSTIAPDGRTNLAPFSFYNMVSANPPLVIFCPGLNRDGRPKDSLINVEKTHEFVVATVVPDIAMPMAATAASLPYGQSEFEFSGLTPAPARHVRAPLVKEAPVNIECRLHQIVRSGDGPGASSIVFGRIVAIHIDPALLDEHGHVDPRRLTTVGRLGGPYYADANDPYELKIPKGQK